MTAIVWFRRDLRVHDHPGLAAAVRDFERVVPVFVLDPRLIHGRYPSSARTGFLLDSLRELRQALRERRGGVVHAHAAVRRRGAEQRQLAVDLLGRRRPQPFYRIVEHRVERALTLERYRAVVDA